MSEKVNSESAENSFSQSEPELLEKSGGPDSSVEEEPQKAESEEDQKPKNGKKRKKIFFIGGAALLVLAVGGFFYWLYARQFESTDDAFVDGDIVQISPRVAAYVTRIYVKGNQFVHKGDLLVELNPQDLQVKLEQAKAQLQSARSQRSQAAANVDLTKKTTDAAQIQARSNVSTASSNVEQTRRAADAKKALVNQAQAAVKTAQSNLDETRARILQAESNLKLADVEYKRRLSLFDHGDVSRQSLDQALNARQTAESQLNAIRREVDAAQSRVNESQANVLAANENYRQALAQVDVTRSQVDESKGRLVDANAAPERIDVSQTQVGTTEASIAQAEAALHEAELELTYTKIYAPEDGYVTRKTVEEGQLVAVGTPMMAISMPDDIWVVANFKETQLENMKIGQPVSIRIDAYPNAEFKGHVESVQAGTGSRFSLLPAENASGNFVKVVQRVPVKIVFDEKPNDNLLLAPGMSAEPSVKVR